MNGVAGRSEILALEHRPEIVDDRQREAFRDDLPHKRRSVRVAREDDWERVIAAEARPRPGRGDELGNLDHVGRRAAIDAARQQDNVRPQLADALDLLMRPTLVVGRDDVHNDRACAKSSTLGTLRRHFADDPGHHHLQPASGARRGDIEIAALTIGCRLNEPSTIVHEPSSGQLLDFDDRVDDTNGHVSEGRLHSGRRLAAVRLAIHPVNALNEDAFGRGAAAVGGKNHSCQRGVWSRHRVSGLRLRSAPSASTASRRPLMYSIDPRCSRNDESWS